MCTHTLHPHSVRAACIPTWPLTVHASLHLTLHESSGDLVHVLLQPLIPWSTTNPTPHLLADGWGVALLHRMLLYRISTTCSSYYSCSPSPHTTSVHAARIRYSICGLAGYQHSDQPLALWTRCPGHPESYVCHGSPDPSPSLPLHHMCALRDHLTMRLDTLGTSQQWPSRVISTVDPGSPLRGYSPYWTAVLCSCSSLIQVCRYYAGRSCISSTYGMHLAGCSTLSTIMIPEIWTPRDLRPQDIPDPSGSRPLQDLNPQDLRPLQDLRPQDLDLSGSQTPRSHPRQHRSRDLGPRACGVGGQIHPYTIYLRARA